MLIYLPSTDYRLPSYYVKQCQTMSNYRLSIVLRLLTIVLFHNIIDRDLVVDDRVW
jgi:hypothetical protein